MSLQEQIREDMVKAMKERDTDVVSILRVVAGEFGREMKSSKELSDEDATAIIKKMVEDANTLGNTGEVEILEKYLPKKLTEKETREIIELLIVGNNYSGMKNMGMVMGLLSPMTKTGEMDGKFASQVVREMLTK